MSGTEPSRVCAVENCANVTALLLRLSGDWSKIVNIPICAPCRIRLAKRAVKR